MPQQDAVFSSGQAAYPVLLYRGVPMDPRPRGVTIDKSDRISFSGFVSLRSIAHDIVAGNNCWLTLEPGDATRYDVIVCPVYNPRLELLVARTTPSGNFRAAHTVPDRQRQGDFAFHTGADAVAINDGWERLLFRWWLECLWVELRAVR